MNQSSEVPVDAPLASPPVTQFRIIHVMYVMAMLGISLAVFGPWGTWSALIVLTFWGTVWYSNISRLEAFGTMLSMFLLFCCVTFFLGNIPSYTILPLAYLIFTPCTIAVFFFTRCNIFLSTSFVFLICLGIIGYANAQTDVREAARRNQCVNNLKQLGLALHNYYDIHGSFPPPYIADENGTPMHSWRVLILPELGYKTLYQQYSFDEPWNGPSNIKLLDQMPSEYLCPSSDFHKHDHKNCTCYLAVVGPDCIWSEEQTRGFADIVDGSSNTALLTEFGESETLWLEPSDMEYQAAIKILSSNDPDVFKEIHPGGRNVLRADGSVHFTPSGHIPEFWSAILSINDPEYVDLDTFEPRPILERPDPWPFATGMQPIIFVVVMLLPLPWVWIKPKVVGSSDDPVDLELP